MSRRAVLQSVSARERYDRQKDSGCDRTYGKGHTETSTRSACTHETAAASRHVPVRAPRRPRTTR